MSAFYCCGYPPLQPKRDLCFSAPRPRSTPAAHCQLTTRTRQLERTTSIPRYHRAHAAVFRRALPGQDMSTHVATSTSTLTGQRTELNRDNYVHAPFSLSALSMVYTLFSTAAPAFSARNSTASTAPSAYYHHPRMLCRIWNSILDMVREKVNTKINPPVYFVRNPTLVERFKNAHIQHNR